MATNGEKFTAQALKYEGVREATGRNDGPLIERWQAVSGRVWNTNYAGAPWCAIFTENMQIEAGLSRPNPRLFHPYTGYQCQEADQLGGLRPGGVWPVGSLIIWCSTHVGIVVRDRGDGLVDTIEGNAGNAVRRMVRSKAGARCIVWPGCGNAQGGTVFRNSYGFDDVALQPTTFGPWASKKGRDEKMAAYEVPADCWGPVAVRLDKDGPQYAFRVGKPGVPYTDADGNPTTWRFGGWASKATRDDVLERYKANNPNAKTRTWRKRVADVPGGGQSPPVSTT